jgi:valyl-tRNA synthetase
MEKRYSHLEQENKISQHWEEQETFSFKNDGKEVFSIDTPPPTVSGSLHIGHVFSYTHTDLIARYQRMLGKDVFYPMGFDDNGLPTERFVEKKCGVRGHEMKRSEFIDLCLKECGLAEKEFEILWKRLGLSIDWSHTYSTISPRVRKISQYSFIDLYKKGLVSRKSEPSLYCTTCTTSVAQAELDSSDVASTFNTIEFSSESGDPLLIATTRPELLPACVAVFYHPNDERYKKLEGQKATTPVFGKSVPILPDEMADPEKGTGLVMCCTFGDSTDILWWKKHKLPEVKIIDPYGKWTQVAGPLAGMRVHSARKKVLELLEESGKLKEQKQISHNVNVHERCGKEIEYLVLQQWFIKIIEQKEKFLELADQIEWSPEFMKSRYRDWVQNLGWDWCISRQRFFGIPFPAWHCQDCNKTLLAEQKDLPIDPQETDFPGKVCTECKSNNIVPDTDVMDTWTTSALTPQINAHWPEKEKVSIPMSMRPQAHDIIRTWAFYTIAKAHFHNNSIPWKKIVVSGHVLAAKGKISKSKGGDKMTPEFLLSNYSADAVRYWAARGRPGMDTLFSEAQLKVGQRLSTKLWNAFSFCREHLQSYKPTEKAPELNNVSKWLHFKFEDSKRRYHNYFKADDYTGSLETIEQFFWHDFCDNYLEMIKDQLFNPENYSAAEIESTKHSLFEIGFGILQLYAPFVSFVTESIYQEIFTKFFSEKSLHNTTFKETPENVESFKTSHEQIEEVCRVVALVRKSKSENSISLKTAIETLTVYATDKHRLEALISNEALLKGVTNSETVVYKNEQLEDGSGGMKKVNDEKWNMRVGLK